MTLIATLDFEDQATGSPVTVTSPWSIAGTAPTATTAAAVHGALGASVDASSFGAIDCGGLNPSSPIVADFYLTPRVRSGAPVIANMRASGTSSAQVRWNSDGTVAIRDGTTVVSTGTVVLQMDTTYRVAWRTSTAGTQTLRLYLGEGDAPIDELSGTIANTSITEVRFGAVNKSAGTLFDLDTIRVADDWLEPVNPATETHTHFYVSGGQLVPLSVSPARPSPAPTVTVFSASEGGTGSNAYTAAVDLDANLANAVGEPTPFIAGRHVYSGNNFPTYAGSSAKEDYDHGWRRTVLNVKCDWSDLAGGAWDSHITQFISDIPEDQTVYLIINHEPENDNDPDGPASWCAGQARAANLIASLNDPRCHFAVCHMAYTWVPSSGRDPEDWNPTAGMTQAALDRTIFAPDGYTDVLNASGTNWESMQSVFDPVFADARAWGFTRLGISEHALNNDVGAPPSAVANIWESNFFPYIDSLGLAYYAGYSSEGPAAGTNARLDSPEEYAAFATWIKQLKETP